MKYPNIATLNKEFKGLKQELADTKKELAQLGRVVNDSLHFKIEKLEPEDVKPTRNYTGDGGSAQTPAANDANSLEAPLDDAPSSFLEDGNCTLTKAEVKDLAKWVKEHWVNGQVSTWKGFRGGTSHKHRKNWASKFHKNKPIVQQEIERLNGN